MAIFVWQIGHIFCVNVRRVGDNQVILQFWQVTEQIGADWRDVMNQTVFFDVVFGNGQRVGGYIHRVDFRFRVGVRAGNRDTAAAGTHIQNVLWLMVDQTREVVVDQLTNR
ncbi:hypothetical protein D3C86_1615430 [compost metagenome]